MDYNSETISDGITGGDQTSIKGSPNLVNTQKLTTGSGKNKFVVGQDGVFCGGIDFKTSPWALTYNGEQYVGPNGEIILDGPNKRIIVKDDNSASQIILNGTDGTLRFNYAGTNYGYLVADASNNLVYVSTSAHFFRDATQEYASLKVDGLHLESGKAIWFNAGTTITDAGYEMRLDRDMTITGNIFPSATQTYVLGDSSAKWFNVVSKYITPGDIIFQDTHCPICELEFQEEDFLINFTYKKDITDPQRPLIHTVPVHSGCMQNYISTDKEKVRKYIEDMALARDVLDEKLATELVKIKAEKDSVIAQKIDTELSMDRSEQMMNEPIATIIEQQ